MKLLLDQNLSYQLCDALKDIYPEIVQVGKLGLRRASDTEIWQYARQNASARFSTPGHLAALWQSENSSNRGHLTPTSERNQRVR